MSINARLVEMWDATFDSDMYQMHEVVMDRPTQEKLHMEMRGDLGLEQRYHFCPERRCFIWRNMPIKTEAERSDRVFFVEDLEGGGEVGFTVTLIPNHHLPPNMHPDYQGEVVAALGRRPNNA